MSESEQKEPKQRTRKPVGSSSYERGKRRQTYLPASADALRLRLAEQYHNGNGSAFDVAAINFYALHIAEREEMIRQSILDLAAATEPDERYDPVDDERPEQPFLALVGLLDEQAARAIQAALTEIWLKWVLKAGADTRDGAVSADQG